MSSGSSTLSKIKVGRLWGYPIIVTTGKSKHEAILLECNTDDPQQFLDEQIDVKIRWKIAGYNESVPARNVVLQDIDGFPASKKRKIKLPSVSKKRRIDKNVGIADKDKPSAVTSGIHVKKEEEVETDNDEEMKP